MTFLWLVITVGILIGQCLATATFQIDLFGAQKRNLPLSSIIDYRQTSRDTVKNIHFVYYSRQGYESGRHTLLNDNSSERYCQPGEEYAILIHGWKETCETEWISLLASNLTVFRGGCIICMDYSAYSKQSYMSLFGMFSEITEVLTGKLRQMEKRGFSPERAFLFGFSYGGRLALEAAERFGPRRISQIDICDIAGPMFDFRKALTDYRRAAKNVQCIFTSRDKGSRHTTACHQNWKMGNCGWSQVAAQDPPMGSHGLCPYFYLSAFINDFPAVKKPSECGSRKMANHWPPGFKMGYRESRKSQVSGELFALTTKYYPYNSNFTNPREPPNFQERKLVSSYDIDMDYNAQPNYIPRSRRNPFLEDYMMTTLKY